MDGHGYGVGLSGVLRGIDVALAPVHPLSSSHRPQPVVCFPARGSIASYLHLRRRGLGSGVPTRRNIDYEADGLSMFPVPDGLVVKDLLKSEPRQWVKIHLGRKVHGRDVLSETFLWPTVPGPLSSSACPPEARNCRTG